MSLKFPEPEWISLIEICEEWGIKVQDALRVSAEGKLNLHAYASAEQNAAYFKSLADGTEGLEQWDSSNLIVLTMDIAKQLMRKDIVWLREWKTADGISWSGNWTHGSGGAKLLPIEPKSLMMSMEEKRRFEEFHDANNKTRKSKASRTTEENAGTETCTEPMLNWKMRIQAEASARWTRCKKSGAQPNKNNIKDELAQWCKDNNVKTSTGLFPQASYIATHVLRKWTPPTD